MTGLGITGIVAACCLLPVLAGCSESSLQAHSDDSGNLLQNPGFELIKEKEAVGWTPETRAANKGQVQIANAPVHTGVHSLKLTPNQNNNQPGIAGMPLGAGQAFQADRFRGKKLYLSGWLGAEGGATAVAGIYALKKNGSVELVELTQAASNGKLVYLNDSLNVSNDRNISYIILNCHVDGTSGAAYFDDLYVGTSERPIPVSGRAEPSRPPLAAEVIIHADRDIRPVPPTIYGTNVEWIRNANGLIDPRTKDLNDRMVTLTKDLGVGLLRFPGGIFCDFYHWKNGIGPLASRPVTLHMPGTNETSPNNFGTDEALMLSQRLGAPLLITVNIVTGTPPEAVEWLQYIRARTGPGKAPPVTYWEIGNENYIKGDAPYLQAATMGPDEYARRFTEFAHALKAADPSVKVGAISDENYGRKITPAYPNWTAQVLARTASLVDFIAVHNAYVPMVIDPRGLSVRDVYAGMLAAPELVGQSLRHITELIGRYDQTGRIKIAVTEWGPMFHILPSSPYVDHVKTLGSALYAASVMQTLLQAQRVEVADFFKLSDALFMGWIGNRQGNWIPNAPYFAFQLYTQHFGNVLVDSTTEVPGYRSRAVGWVDSVSNVPYLAVLASRSTDRKKLYLMAVNRNFDQDIPTTIQIHDAKPRGRGIAWILTGSGIDANTGTELPKGAAWARQAEDDRNPRFDKGQPNEIVVKSEEVSGIGPRFDYVVPKHSVISLEVPLP
jgi:alpha-N-arabinofuranosidase